MKRVFSLYEFETSAIGRAESTTGPGDATCIYALETNEKCFSCFIANFLGSKIGYSKQDDKVK